MRSEIKRSLVALLSLLVFVAIGKLLDELVDRAVPLWPFLIVGVLVAILSVVIMARSKPRSQL